MIEKKLHLGDLFVFYGELLTDNQKDILNMYLLEDYSLIEIAELKSVSRQAVYDVVKKTEVILEGYENKLNLLTRFEYREKVLRDIIKEIDEITQKNDKFTMDRLINIKEKAEEILD